MGVQQQLSIAIPAKGIVGRETNGFASAKLLAREAGYLEKASATVQVKQHEPLPAPQNASLLGFAGVIVLAAIYARLFSLLKKEKIAKQKALDGYNEKETPGTA